MVLISSCQEIISLVNIRYVSTWLGITYCKSKCQSFCVPVWLFVRLSAWLPCCLSSVCYLPVRLSVFFYLCFSLFTFHIHIFTLLLIGLSKERPILGDHAKAHIFGLHSENTPIKPRRITWKAYEKHMKSATFHDERPLARNCNPMVFFVFP